MSAARAQLIKNAVASFRQAEAIVVTCGAGMGVDSGLPDFRGDKGFWKEYPPIAERGLSFIECADPEHFNKDPDFAWGFYGHRLHLYQACTPGEHFHILKRLMDATPHGGFVFTSNVDGQFQKAGYDDHRIVECHGSIHHLQVIFIVTPPPFCLMMLGKEGSNFLPKRLEGEDPTWGTCKREKQG